MNGFKWRYGYFIQQADATSGAPFSRIQNILLCELIIPHFTFGMQTVFIFAMFATTTQQGPAPF